MKVGCQTHSSLTSNKKVYIKLEGIYWQVLIGGPMKRKGYLEEMVVLFSNEMRSIKVCRRSNSSSHISTSPHC